MTSSLKSVFNKVQDALNISSSINSETLLLSVPETTLKIENESKTSAIYSELVLKKPGKKQTFNMESLISVINKLQDVFNTVGSEALQLPQIVVIGSQSAGKSSVIESLVGRNFLPRGTGIVTRRPLILQLIYCPLDDKEHRSVDKGTSELEEWGEFLHKPEPFLKFDEIRKEIEDETDRVAGSNKGIVHDPINLKVFSSRVVNLTLVDLPGITKVPVGDQPEDIEEQIKELVFKYIRNPNSIILAVSAANTDFANSEALKFGRQVDPDGKRTLAVLTKLDLMDEGTNAVEVLSGNVIPVKLGIIGVVNRSQQAIIDNKDIDEQLKFESEYLNEKYPNLAYKNGTKYLAETMNKLLMNHIRECLPDLRKRVNDKSLEYQTKMNGYGKTIYDQKETLTEIVTNFTAAYGKILEGTVVDDECDSTKLYEIIHEKFGRIFEQIEPNLKVKEKEIEKSLLHSNGPRPTLFDTPSFDGPFEKLVKENINMLLDPSKHCVEKVHKEMIRLIKNCGTEVQRDLMRFPKVEKKISEVTKNFIEARMKVTMEDVENIIHKQKAYINKKHPDFDAYAALRGEKCEHDEKLYLNFDEDSYAAKRKVSGNPPSNPPSNPVTQHDFTGRKLSLNEKKVVLKHLIKDKFYIIRKTVQDLVPKSIMYFMVDHVKKNLKGELLRQMPEIYNQESAKDLMSEAKDVAIGRKHATEMLEALSKANQIIGEISEFGPEWDSYEMGGGVSEN